MNCPACGHENPIGQRFCGQCGTRLELRCSVCDTLNPPGNKFCGECGAPLGAAPAPIVSAPATAPPGRPGVPASFSNGRYELRKFLGEGGKKLVYLAHDVLLDRDVALALIKTEGLDEVGRERVRREAQAMGRLGAHPHIVGVFDFGDHEGQPFIVTELMGGGDVEGLVESAPDHRIPLERALRIAEETCRALEFAHEQHIVHRDLKPGNVWLTADGTAKLGDFGLAVATDRSRLTQAGLMVGTVSYMPPEQALGGEVTPRSDLYSLGAMLYELVVGRPPFVGDESVAIITQHLNVPPVAPSWHNPRVPPALEALILRLLEKDPSRRPASASEVREILAAVDITPALTPRPLPEGEGADPAPSPLAGKGVGGLGSPIYRRTFVGREVELRQAQAAFDRACSGQGGILMVAGEPGIGKTALCEQLATYAAMRGGRALVGHSYEEGSVSLPYLPFMEAMRSYVVERDSEGLRRDLGSGAAQVARIVSEIRDRLNLEPTAQPSGSGAQLAVDPDEERWRLLQAVTDFLRNASGAGNGTAASGVGQGGQPLLVVLEDLHWADRGTLDLLTHLARNLQGARLLVLGTYRDVDVDRAHPLSWALAELRRGSGFDRLLLRGLSAEEVQRMLGAISNQDVAWGFAEAVYRQTEGNPLFVQEVARYLAEAGLVVRENGRWRPNSATPLELHIPEGLREVIGRRLARLTPECNRVLTLASVVGREFTLEALQAIAGADEEAVVTVLDEAVRVGVLQEEARVGGAHYRFAHAFFAQTLYEEMSVPRRLRVHQQVGRVLEEQYEERIEDHAVELAEHFAHSSDPADLRRAVAYGEIAAQRAISVNAYGEAVRHLEHALDVQTVLQVPDDREQGCDLLLAQGQALLPSGDPRRAFEDVAPRALALAEALGNRGRAARACRVAYEGLMRYGGPAAWRLPAHRQWAELTARYADPGSRLQVYADVAMSYVHLADEQWRDARQRAARAYALAGEIGDAESIYWSGARMMFADVSPQGQGELVALATEFTSRPRQGVSSRTLEVLLRRSQMIFLAAGERERADAAWAELDGLASHTQDASLLSWPDAREALRATLDGDLEGAVAWAERTETRVERENAAVTAALLGFWPLLALGRFDNVQPGEGTSQRVVVLARQGRRAEAASALGAMMERLRISQREDVPCALLADLLDASVLIGDRGLAPILAEQLRGVVATELVYTLSNVARYRGAAAALVGDRARALAAYGEGLAWAERIRFRPEVALTRFGLAEVLLDDSLAAGDSPDEKERAHVEARGHLDFAIEEFRAMKMQPSLERALSHKGLLEA